MLHRFLRLPFSLVLVMSGFLATALGGAQPVAASGTTIVNVAAHKCLDLAVNSPTNGVQVQIDTCNGSPTQFWSFIRLGNGSFLILNEQSGKCLTVLANSPLQNAAVVQGTCNPSGSDPFEDWRQVPSTPPFTLTNLGDGLMMEPLGCRTASGTRVVVASALCAERFWS